MERERANSKPADCVTIHQALRAVENKNTLKIRVSFFAAVRSGGRKDSVAKF